MVVAIFKLGKSHEDEFVDHLVSLRTLYEVSHYTSVRSYMVCIVFTFTPNYNWLLCISKEKIPLSELHANATLFFKTDQRF